MIYEFTIVFPANTHVQNRIETIQKDIEYLRPDTFRHRSDMSVFAGLFLSGQKRSINFRDMILRAATPPKYDSYASNIL